jgi:lambda family phage portal protein
MPLGDRGRECFIGLRPRLPNGVDPMASTELVQVPGEFVLHLFRPLRPGQLRGQPRLTQVLIKLHELDQYDDAELVRNKTAAMFAGFVTKNGFPARGANPDATGAALAGMEPGTLQVLLPGEDVKFSSPADVGAVTRRSCACNCAASRRARGSRTSSLTGDLTGVNYSSIRACLLEFRCRCEEFKYPVIVFQIYPRSGVRGSASPCSRAHCQPEKQLTSVSTSAWTISRATSSTPC